MANRLPKRSGAGVRGGCGGQAPGRANVVPKLAARSASSRRHGPARVSARIDAMRAGPPADICSLGGGGGLPATGYLYGDVFKKSQGQSVMREVQSVAREFVPLKDHNDIVFTTTIDALPYFSSFGRK